jgi:hypothetical protein
LDVDQPLRAVDEAGDDDLEEGGSARLGVFEWARKCRLVTEVAYECTLLLGVEECVDAAVVHADRVGDALEALLHLSLQAEDDARPVVLRDGALPAVFVAALPLAVFVIAAILAPPFLYL